MLENTLISLGNGQWLPVLWLLDSEIALFLMACFIALLTPGLLRSVSEAVLRLAAARGGGVKPKSGKTLVYELSLGG